MFIRNDVNPGPARWDRAKANAEKKPDSHGAKLYRSRVEIATELSTQYSDVPYQIQRNKASFYQRDTDPVWKREHSLCGSYCAALQVQLSRHDTPGKYAAHEAMSRKPYHKNGERLTALKVGDLKRSVKCFVCGCIIEKDLTTSGTSFTSVQPEASNVHVHVTPKITVRADTMRSIIEGLESIENDVNGYGELKECVVDVSENDVRITATFDKREWTLELESVQT